VYWYFSSKEDLLKAVLAESFESLGVLLEEAAALPMTSLEKLDYLLGRNMTSSREHSDFVRIFITLLALPYLPDWHVPRDISRLSGFRHAGDLFRGIGMGMAGEA